MTKKMWLKEAAKLFKAAGSKMPAARANALFRHDANGQMASAWMRKSRNKPAASVAREILQSPYGE